MNLWLLVVLAVVIALYVFVSMNSKKKTTVKCDYRSSETVKTAGKCLVDGSVNIVKGIWLIGGFVGATIIDGWKAILKKSEEKSKAKSKAKAKKGTKQEKMIKW